MVSAVPDIEHEHDVNMIQDLKKDILPVTILRGVKNAYLSIREHKKIVTVAMRGTYYHICE